MEFDSKRVKLLLLGESKAGKTSSLATLANAGYKVRILDLDNNLQILGSYLTPEARANVTVRQITMGEAGAWEKAKAALTKDPWGDLGPVSSWEPDTVLVVDSASFLSETCAVANRKKFAAQRATQFEQAIWGDIADDFMQVVSFLTSPKVKCDVIFICHVRQLELNDPRKYPYLVGKYLPKHLGRSFNSIWLLEVKADGKRVIKTTSNHLISLATLAPGVIQPEENADIGNMFKRIKS